MNKLLDVAATFSCQKSWNFSLINDNLPNIVVYIPDSRLRDQSLGPGLTHHVVLLDKKLHYPNIFLTQVQKGELPN